MSPILSRSLASAAAALGSAVLIVAAGAQPERLVYVDTRIAAPSCTTYESSARACGRGAGTAFKTIAAAAASAQSGTTVVIRDGTYREPLVPQNSGTADAPIVFKSAANESVVISDVDAPAIQIIARHYITVDGLTVKNVTGWARLQDSTHIVIQHTSFSHSTAPGTTGGLKVVRSSLNRIADNRFEDGNDDLLLQDSSNFNLVEGNTFAGAAHSLLSIRCANVNAIRGNRFDNAVQKAIEIFDCEAVSDAPFQLDATKRNLIERNVFLRTRGSVSNYKYNAIQHGAQYTIVRRNVFSNAAGGGVNFQQYASESLFVYGNRLYHNTFYSNRCFAIVGNRGAPKQYYDNRALNNLLYLNRDCAGSGDQVSIDDPAAVILTANAVESRDPVFVDEHGGDFHLAPGSRMIDRAGALTVTTSAGQGTSIPVRDVLPFVDTVLVPGESGDEIQLVGTTDRARVVRAVWDTQTLTLDRPLTWRLGQGIALAYAGLAPDFGAFEAQDPPLGWKPRIGASVFDLGQPRLPMLPQR